MMIQSTSRCFVYGTLMSQEVLRTLLGRVPEMDPRPAFLPQQYSRHPVKGRVFPGVIENSNEETTSKQQQQNRERVKGILLSGITRREMEIFDWFEDVAYDRCSVNVVLQSSDDSAGSDSVVNESENIDADVYIWNAGADLLDVESSWSFEHFCTHKLPWYLRTTVRPCREEYDKQKQQR